MRNLKLLLVILTLAGCAVKQKLTAIEQPAQVITVPVKTYVPIPPELTALCPWPRDQRLRDVIKVARERANCLEAYESQFNAIRGVSGLSAPDGPTF